ncbi:MAG: hypothetical protein HFI68_03115 [Lachnospiraceae bacterium]|nr:hypothetical protein [Lachnospiraceae bacterium]
MKKKWKSFSLAAALLLILGLSIPDIVAQAEDLQGEAGWQVTFDGKKMENNFTTGGMSDEIGAMQPGDSVELTITLKNTFDGQADWYMKNQVLQSLEDAGDAAGGAYDYLLTYTDTKGETTTLYSSEKFGGDGRINGVGLHGATKSLDDYFYLDRMGKGDSGVVKLKVALDGETLVNDYQNTLARLQMDFATELVSSGGGSGNKIIKTGDEADILRNIIIMFASGLVLLIGGILLLRRQKEDGDPTEAVLVEAEGKTGERRDRIR